MKKTGPRQVGRVERSVLLDAPEIPRHRAEFLFPNGEWLFIAHEGLPDDGRTIRQTLKAKADDLWRLASDKFLQESPRP